MIDNGQFHFLGFTSRIHPEHSENFGCTFSTYWLFTIFEPNCAICTLGSYAPLSVCKRNSDQIFCLTSMLTDCLLMAFLQGPVEENAHHMCKLQGGLTANVKLHFLLLLLFYLNSTSIIFQRYCLVEVRNMVMVRYTVTQEVQILTVKYYLLPKVNMHHFFV